MTPLLSTHRSRRAEKFGDLGVCCKWLPRISTHLTTRGVIYYRLPWSPVKRVRLSTCGVSFHAAFSRSILRNSAPPLAVGRWLSSGRPLQRTASQQGRTVVKSFLFRYSAVLKTIQRLVSTFMWHIWWRTWLTFGDLWGQAICRKAALTNILFKSFPKDIFLVFYKRQKTTKIRQKIRDLFWKFGSCKNRRNCFLCVFLARRRRRKFVNWKK